MPKGLLDYGEAELSGATKGMLRASDLQQEEDMANLQIESQKRMQSRQLSTELGMAGGVGGYMLGSSSIAAGAGLGAWGGGVGMVAGAALGFLVSKLF